MISIILFTLMAVFIIAASIIFMRYQKKITALNVDKTNLEITLRDEKIRFENIFAHTTTGIAFLKLDGRFLRINKAYCELLGFNEEEMQATNVFYLLPQN